MSMGDTATPRKIEAPRLRGHDGEGPAERQISFAEAIREGLDTCLRDDPRVYLLGLGVPDPIGIFGTTKGLVDQYGPKRVMDMPIAENAMTGIALGSAITGLRPVMTHMRLEFAMLAIDQLTNQAAKWRYMFGGRASAPMVIRLIVGRGWGQGPQHSQSLHAWFSHIPGLKVVMPATPADAKGLLISSIDDDGPVIFIEHRWLYNMTGPVPEGAFRAPLGEPRLIVEGADATIVAASYMTLEATKAAKILVEKGLSVDLIDLRTLNPLDDSLIIESVRKTRRLVVCDQATYSAGYAGEIVSRVCEKAFDSLACAPIRVTLPDSPTPTTRALTNYYYPTSAHIVAAVLRTLGLSAPDPFDDVSPEDYLDVPDKRYTGPF